METTEKQVARRYYELYGTGDLDEFDEILDPAMRGHAGAGATPAEFKANLAGFRVPFPDMRAEVRHLIQEGDMVSTWVSWTATHRDQFAGVPATGRSIKFAGWDLMRIRDGRIVELTSFCDLYTVLSQIGALPAPTPA